MNHVGQPEASKAKVLTIIAAFIIASVAGLYYFSTPSKAQLRATELFTQTEALSYTITLENIAVTLPKWHYLQQQTLGQCRKYKIQSINEEPAIPLVENHQALVIDRLIDLLADIEVESKEWKALVSLAKSTESSKLSVALTGAINVYRQQVVSTFPESIVLDFAHSSNQQMGRISPDYSAELNDLLLDIISEKIHHKNIMVASEYLTTDDLLSAPQVINVSYYMKVEQYGDTYTIIPVEVPSELSVTIRSRGLGADDINWSSEVSVKTPEKVSKYSPSEPVAYAKKLVAAAKRKISSFKQSWNPQSIPIAQVQGSPELPRVRLNVQLIVGQEPGQDGLPSSRVDLLPPSASQLSVKLKALFAGHLQPCVIVGENETNYDAEVIVNGLVYFAKYGKDHTVYQSYTNNLPYAIEIMVNVENKTSFGHPWHGQHFFSGDYKLPDTVDDPQKAEIIATNSLVNAVQQELQHPTLGK